MPSPSAFDLKLLDLLPDSISGLIKFALLCIVVLVLYKIYEKRRWS